MRILVLSDSHGRAGIVEDIVEKNAEIQHVFFLGDVLRDFETVQYLYPQKFFYSVPGNCDWLDDGWKENTVTLNGVKIFYCHGHTQDVKSGTQRLLLHAKAQKANLALYGHTHRSDIDYRDGVFLVNPGSVSQARGGRNSYAVIDLDEKEIRPAIVTL